MNREKSLVNLKNDSLISVVIPAFNESLVIQESIARIRRVLESERLHHEILVVNDGSTDDTLQILVKLQSTSPLRIINLARNSGHMAAIRAGLEASNGDYVVTIDADLQDPPESIPEMLKTFSNALNGDALNSNALFYDVVQAYRADRSSDSIWKRKSASIYYSFVSKITGITLTPHAADYRIMKRHVVESLLALPERTLVYRLLIPSMGFRVALFPIERNKRFAGSSKYTNRKMVGLAIDSVIGFTNRPLRFLAFAGIFASFILFLGSILTLMIYVFGNTLPGWPSLALLMLSFNAFLFAGLGLVGEYVGRIYQLVQARPGTPWTEF
jgi:dolichol-phosphate mannosyltransferase